MQFKVSHFLYHLTVCHIKSETKHQCNGKEKQRPWGSQISFIGVFFPTVSNSTISGSHSVLTSWCVLSWFLRGRDRFRQDDDANSDVNKGLKERRLLPRLNSVRILFFFFFDNMKHSAFRPPAKYTEINSFGGQTNLWLFTSGQIFCFWAALVLIRGTQIND